VQETNVKHNDVTVDGDLILPNETANRPVQINGSNVLEAVTTSTFRSNYGIAASGANSDITALTGVSLSTYNPTVSASGSMSVTSKTLNFGRWQRLGGFIYFQVSVSFTLGGTASNFIFLTQPAAGVDHGASAGFTCTGNENGVGIDNLRWRYNQGGSQIQVFKAGTGNFTLGANAQIDISGMIEAA
jgi:hypothetical protein